MEAVKRVVIVIFVVTTYYTSKFDIAMTVASIINNTSIEMITTNNLSRVTPEVTTSDLVTLSGGSWVKGVVWDVEARNIGLNLLGMVLTTIAFIGLIKKKEFSAPFKVSKIFAQGHILLSLFVCVFFLSFPI
jgi:hypothetical protein